MSAAFHTTELEMKISFTFWIALQCVVCPLEYWLSLFNGDAFVAYAIVVGLTLQTHNESLQGTTTHRRIHIGQPKYHNHSTKFSLSEFTVAKFKAPSASFGIQHIFNTMGAHWLECEHTLWTTQYVRLLVLFQFLTNGVHVVHPNLQRVKFSHQIFLGLGGVSFRFASNH